LSLQANNRSKITAVILAAMVSLIIAAAALAADSAPDPNKLTLSYGDQKKGEVAMRVNASGGTDAAVEEVTQMLGFGSPRGGLQGITVTYKRKKLEMWNNSNVVRVNGSIVSLPAPLAYDSGHWWADANTTSFIMDKLFQAAGGSAGVKLTSNKKPTVEAVSQDQPVHRWRHRRRW
jgi:hypothetical protein